MSDLSNLKPGDKALLRSKRGFRGRLVLTVVEIEKVYKNGQIILKGSEQRYRSSGYPTGNHPRYSTPPRLQRWDADLWERYQVELAQEYCASDLFALGKVLQEISRDAEAAAKLWDSLPADLRELINERSGA